MMKWFCGIVIRRIIRNLFKTYHSHKSQSCNKQYIAINIGIVIIWIRNESDGSSYLETRQRNKIQWFIPRITLVFVQLYNVHNWCFTCHCNIKASGGGDNSTWNMSTMHITQLGGQNKEKTEARLSLRQQQEQRKEKNSLKANVHKRNVHKRNVNTTNGNDMHHHHHLSTMMKIYSNHGYGLGPGHTYRIVTE